MTYDDLKINNAIHECLDRCYRTDDTLAQIAQFLEELNAAGDWRAAEIREVELAVHKLLHGVVESPIYRGEATNYPREKMRPAGFKPRKVNDA